MAATAPTPVATLGTPPSTASPAAFDTNADAFLGDLPDWGDGMNALADVTYDNAVEAYNQALAATTNGAAQVVLATAQAVAAASSASSAASIALTSGAALWVTGTTYAIGDDRKSPANLRVYTRKTVGAGSTDPSADTTNWELNQPSPPAVVVSATSVTASAYSHYVLTNVAATTLTLPASPLAGDLVVITAANGLTTNSVARNGQTIMGASEDMTLDTGNQTTSLRFLNSDWKIV